MRHTLANLWITLTSFIHCLRLSIHGWRYPLTTRMYRGEPFTHRGDMVELLLFNRLKYSGLTQLLEQYTIPLSVVAAVEGQQVWVNVYRLIKDRGEADMLLPTRLCQGEDGQFLYMSLEGTLRHAKRLTAWSRERGYLADEPVFSFVLPLSERELSHLKTLRDAPQHEELIIGDPRVALGILAEPLH